MTYIEQFYCIASSKRGRVDCIKKPKQVCNPMIMEELCRKCLEEVEGLIDVFVDVCGGMKNEKES